MAADEDLTDNYIASLLAKDAKESSVKYSTVGLEAFARSKPPANKPKPNTRFLRNIIKDTDSHNAALLAKEAAESRARLEKLAKSSPQRVERQGGDIRKRQLGDIAAILGGRPGKRKRVEREGREGREGRRVNTSSEDEKEERPRAKHARERKYDLEDRPRGKESGERKDKDRDEDTRSRGHRSHRRRRSVSEERGKDREGRRERSRSRSPREHRSKDKESRHRHRSPRRKRSRSPDPHTSRDKSHHSHRHRRSPSNERKPSKPEPKKPDYDSDPLDDIIGPRPPPISEVRRKGRGTISQASGIDSRFSANYDPTADVQLDFDEENDWDQALEALKDRVKWKQQGADRLRAAGFTEEEVGKWERGGEKREEDVRWSKKGEGREWDRGKVVGDDGAVSIEPKFGRLTDS